MRIEESDRRDGRAEDVHGRRGLGYLSENVHDWLRERAAPGKVGAECFEVLAAGERLKPEEVGNLFEGGSPREVMDVDAAVNELPALAIDVRDPRVSDHDSAEPGGGRRRCGCCRHSGAPSLTL